MFLQAACAVEAIHIRGPRTPGFGQSILWSYYYEAVPQPTPSSCTYCTDFQFVLSSRCWLHQRISENVYTLPQDFFRGLH